MTSVVSVVVFLRFLDFIRNGIFTLSLTDLTDAMPDAFPNTALFKYADALMPDVAGPVNKRTPIWCFMQSTIKRLSIAFEKYDLSSLHGEYVFFNTDECLMICTWTQLIIMCLVLFYFNGNGPMLCGAGTEYTFYFGISKVLQYWTQSDKDFTVADVRAHPAVAIELAVITVNNKVKVIQRLWRKHRHARRQAAAILIQQTWRDAISNPNILLCRRRLLREFSQLC
jgi:hypothetical protein